MADLPHLTVLVLNKYFTSIHVCSLARAIALVYTSHAEVIAPRHGQFLNFSFGEWLKASSNLHTIDLDESQETYITTPRIRFLAPRVIRLTHSGYIANGEKKLRPTRKNIFLRDEYRCQYCKGRFGPTKLNVDHVMPKSRGGKLTWENVVASCRECNTRKGNQLPEEADMRLIRTPKKPNAQQFFLHKLDPYVLSRFEAFLGFAK